MDAHERILLRARRKAARHAESQAWQRRTGTRTVEERNLSSTPEIPGAEIAECLGLVSVTVARANNALRDVATSWRDTFGGRLGAFGKLADDARVEALAELRDEAGRRGAGAVVGVRIDVTAPTTSVLVVTVSGTAVTLVEDEAAPAGDTAADESPAEDDPGSGPAPL